MMSYKTISPGVPIITIVCLDLADILLGLYLDLLVLLNVVTDRVVVTEVHFAGLVDVERLAGDVDQAGVETEEEEDWLQRDLTETELEFVNPVHPGCWSSG